MNEYTQSKWTVGFGLSYSLISILSALLVVIKENNKTTVFEWMKTITGHHWVTHGLFVVMMFLILGWFFSFIRVGKTWITPTQLLVYILISTVVSSLIISGYFFL